MYYLEQMVSSLNDSLMKVDENINGETIQNESRVFKTNMDPCFHKRCSAVAGTIHRREIRNTHLISVALHNIAWSAKASLLRYAAMEGDTDNTAYIW